MATSAEISKILNDMRDAIDSNKFIPIKRTKNKNTLAQLGWTWTNVKSEIYTLTIAEYYSGPDIDRDFPQTDKFWIFKKIIDGQTIYIKFKVLYQEIGQVKVVSFHFDEVP